MTVTADTPGTDQEAPRGRGRPRTFDEEAVLDALTALFWRQGFEATSVADITAEAGLNTSSLYNTFGSKQDLFDRILDRYVAARMDVLAGIIAEAGDGVAALHGFLDMVRMETETDLGRNGCLAVNTSAELGASAAEMAERYRDQLSERLRGIISRAADAGQLDPTQVDNHTAMLMTFMLGLSVTVRSGAERNDIGRLIDAAHATVDSWVIDRSRPPRG